MRREKYFLFVFLSIWVGMSLVGLAGTVTRIIINPYTGSLYVETGEIPTSLYEGTFQLQT